LPNPWTESEIVELAMYGEVIDTQAQVLKRRIEDMIERLPATGAMKLAALIALADASAFVLASIALTAPSHMVGQEQKLFDKRIKSTLARYRAGFGSHG
jgi:hypothetical protein